MSSIRNSLAVAALALAAPRAASAELVATPQINAVLADAGAYGEDTLGGTWTVTCTPMTANTTFGWSGMEAVHTATGDGGFEISSGELGAESGTMDSTDMLDLIGSFAGSSLRVNWTGVFCHDGQMNSESVDVHSDDILVPPQLTIFDAINPDTFTSYCTGDGTCAPGTVKMQVGQKLAVTPAMYIHPVETEKGVLHFSGAGVTQDFSFADPNAYNGLQNTVTPTQAGTLKLTLELAPYGLMSNEADIEVDAAGTTTGGTTGDSGSTSGSSSDDSKSGCTSVPGVSLAAMALGLAVLRRRRA